MLAKIAVTIGGLAVMVFVNWYFLLSRRKKR
jgi:plastocyanin domain-containing protein